jgi:hypothetical protein
MMFGICYLATSNVITDFFSRKVEKMELFFFTKNCMYIRNLN